MDEDSTESEGEEDSVRLPNLECEGEDCMAMDPFCSVGTSPPPPPSPQSPLECPPVVPLGLQYGRRPVMKNQLAEKMDVMVATCLQYLHSACHQASPSFNLPEGTVPRAT